MPENDRLNGCLSEIELGIVEREATPQLFMKLGIQIHLAGLSLSNTVTILEIFGVERTRSTVHNWVHKADLQPEQGQSPDHVAVDETVIRLNDEQYWLYAAVDPDTNELLHTTRKPTTNKVLAQSFLIEIAEKHDVDDVPRTACSSRGHTRRMRLVNAVFLVDGSHSLQHACRRHGFDCRYEQHGNRNSVERIFREVKRRTSSFSNCFSNTHAETANEWLRSFAFAWNQLI